MSRVVKVAAVDMYQRAPMLTRLVAGSVQSAWKPGFTLRATPGEQLGFNRSHRSHRIFSPSRVQ